MLTLAIVPNRQREETKRQRRNGIDTVKMGQANSEQALRLLLRSLFLLPRETLSVSSTFQMLPNPTPIQHQTAKTYLNANRVEVTDAEHKYREIIIFSHLKTYHYNLCKLGCLIGKAPSEEGVHHS